MVSPSEGSKLIMVTVAPEEATDPSKVTVSMAESSPRSRSTVAVDEAPVLWAARSVATQVRDQPLMVLALRARGEMAVRVGFIASTAVTCCFCGFSVGYLAVSDTGNGTGSCSIIHGHAGSTVADTYGRGVALGRMKEALEKGFEGLVASDRP